MKNTFYKVIPAIVISSLLAGCANSQHKVFDDLTSTSSNSGGFMHPTKWINPGYPLQTTIVSNNGLLSLNVGDICLASRFREPSEMICKKYAGGGLQAQSFTYSLIFPDKLDDTKNLAEATRALAEAQKTLVLALLAGEAELKIAQETLISAQKELVAILNTANVLVFNWSDGRKASVGEDGASSNTLKGNKNQSGYTIVSGLEIQKINYDCSTLQALKDSRNIFGSNSKLVTMTMSTNKLFYKVEEELFASLEAQIKIADSNKLKALKGFLNGKTLNAMLKSASSLSSQGYLDVEENGTQAKPANLTFFAVLTDIESLYESGLCTPEAMGS